MSDASETREENAIASNGSHIYFAIVGDVHGQFAVTHRLLEAWQKEKSKLLDFVIQVGDIECHRNESDMTSMAAPASKRTLGDFSRLFPHNTEAAAIKWKWPTYFIGGNHECYGWLDDRSKDDASIVRASRPKQVAHNIFYLGRAGYLPIRIRRNNTNSSTQHVATLQLGFMSGIHRPDSYYGRRPAISNGNLASKSNKSWIGFNCYDVSVLLNDESDGGVEQIDDDALSKNDLSENDLSFSEILEKRIRKLLQFGDETPYDLPKADIMFLLRFVFKEQGRDLDNKTRLVYEQLVKFEKGLATDVSMCEFIQLSTVITYFTKKVCGNKRQARFLDCFRRKNRVDIMVTHDWPSGLLADANIQLRGSRPMGNEICRELLNTIQPNLYCCGHMHTSFRATVDHTQYEKKATTTTNHIPEGGVVCPHNITQVCCVSKVSYPHAVAVFMYDVHTGTITEIDPPPQNEILASLNNVQNEDPSDIDE